MQLTAIAIDDEPYSLEVVKLHAQKVPFLDLKTTFTNAFEAIPYLQTNKIDLIFLDINMPDISGIDFVKCLNKKPLVVFITAYSEYAVQGFELDAIDYLLKPFALARFIKACNKALQIQMQHNDDDEYFFLKTGYEEEKILINDIYYLEAEGNYVAYMLKNQPKLLCRQTIAEAYANLPQSKFVRIHRSYVVALAQIQRIGRQSVFINQTEIPIGASYEQALQEFRKK
jgi:DNA-binding LytR/AlgR family response regulator